MDADEAFRYSEAIGARVTIAMHYKTKRSKIDVATPQRFMELSGACRVDNGFEITKENLSALPRFVVVNFD